MSPRATGPTPAARALATRMRVDRGAGSVLGAFGAGGVRAVLLKGASIARWLYADTEPRPYSDVDVLVHPDDARAAAATLDRLGYRRELDERELPDWWRGHSATWIGTADHSIVDVHTTMPGVGVEAAPLWEVVARAPERMDVGGVDVAALGVPARVFYVVLHAAHHGPAWPVPIEDLARALESADEETWREAAAIARELDAVAAFRVGLGLSPRGSGLLQSLDLPQERTVADQLKGSGAPPAALTIELIAAAHGLRPRVGIVWRKLVPPAAFMRTWSPLARRGALGLALAYLGRPFWVAGRVPAALLAWRRARLQAR